MQLKGLLTFPHVDILERHVFLNVHKNVMFIVLKNSIYPISSRVSILALDMLGEDDMLSLMQFSNC